jgi:hypothetical protein
MALIDGPNLKAHVEKRLPVPIGEAVGLFTQIVAGVAHAHQADLIHRDLKPANVLIDRDGRARVTDFGLAKRLTTESQLTQSGQVVGTPHYMAPEQARDSKDVGKPADVYALGAILHFLLTGKPPFHAESYTDLLIKLVTDPPVPPQQQRADVPDDVNALCLMCLAKNPAERPADAVQLAEVLAPIFDRYRGASAPSTPALARLNGPVLPSSGTVPSFSGAVLGGTAHDLSSTTPPVPTHDNMPTHNVRGPGFSAGATQPVAAAAGPAEAAPKASKLPLILGVAVALLAVVAVALFALSNNKKDDTAQNGGGNKIEPPPVLPPGAPPVEWPPVGRSDFALSFEVSGPGMQPQPDGSLRFPEGARAAFALKAERDCFVSIWTLDADGTMVKLFPNEDDRDDRLKAGTLRELPGNRGWSVKLTPTVGSGFDRFRVLATTGAPPEFPAGAPLGKFVVFAKRDEQQEVASTVRGAVLELSGAKPKTGAAAQAEVRYRVPK